MTFFSTLSMSELGTFLRVIQDSLAVRRHQDLFQWLHEDMQQFLPHDILITAWGDFSLGLVHLDVVSYLPGIRTTEVDHLELQPFLFDAFAKWMDSERMPIAFPLSAESLAAAEADESDFGKALGQMRSALVQGIKDERGRHDCLYVALSTQPRFEENAIQAMELLLPYIDAALRQVAHLPVQYPPALAPQTVASSNGAMQEDCEHGLSQREVEIMRWVCLGKTNHEVGTILDISAFTVKNHLQRIFRKLDVINRAQAVARVEKLRLGAHG